MSVRNIYIVSYLFGEVSYTPHSENRENDIIEATDLAAAAGVAKQRWLDNPKENPYTLETTDPDGIIVTGGREGVVDIDDIEAGVFVFNSLENLNVPQDATLQEVFGLLHK